MNEKDIYTAIFIIICAVMILIVIGEVDDE